MRRLAVSTTLLLLSIATHLGAQSVTSDSAALRPAAAMPRPANDSLFRHARRLVSEGNGAAGRALVDSLLRAADPATPSYGDALFWHGALAQTAAEAERDYRRVIVEYPLAYYADDALLSIAELEQARGDRAGALAHLQRFVREHPASASRGIAALGAARLAFEQRDTKTGCTMLAEARASADVANVELRNQIDYYGARCAGATTTASVPPSEPAAPPVPAPAAPAPKVAPPTSVATVPAKSRQPAAARPAERATPAVEKAASKPATKAPATPAAKRETAAHSSNSYTIQVAAYNSAHDAERLVAQLATHGIKARVSGTSKPFRVRLGFYRTRQEATAEVAALKKRGIVGFVAEEARPREARSP